MHDDRHYVRRVLGELATRPAEPVLFWADRHLTAGQLSRQVLAAAQSLRARGIGPGRVVGVLTDANRPDTVALRYAGNLVGATVVHLRGVNAVNPRDALPAAAQIDMVTESGADVLAVDAEHAGRAREIRDGAGRPLILAGTGDFGPDVLDLTAGDPAGFDPASARGEGTAVVTYTSGQTGRPKGIGWSFAVKNDVLETARRPTRRTTILVTAPLSHSSGKMTDNVLAGGGTVVLSQGFEAGAVLADVERHGVTRLFLSAPQMYALLDHPGLARADLSTLRALMYTGCVAAPSRLAQATEVFGQALYQLYGTSETGQISWLTGAQHRDPDLLFTVGRPARPVRVSIRDPQSGREVPAGRPGEVCVRSPWTMAGYWRDDDLTARVVRDGWVHTGDIGRLDDRGFLRLDGRIAEVVKTRGIKVHPEAVENALLAHPDVRMAAVFGHADADRVERLHAVVAVRDGARVTAGELGRHVGRTLSPLHEPATVGLRTELPVIAFGVPDKRRLRAEIFGPDREDGKPLTLGELFEAQTLRGPYATALTQDGVTLSYSQLSRRANRLARLLVTRGAGPGTTVALVLPRSAELIVALLAVAKAGGAYLPVDPAYPAARIEVMLTDAAPVAVLTTSDSAAGLPATAGLVVLDDPAVEDELSRLPGADLTDLDRTAPLRPGHPAYVIYTSGSTGQPKGVVVPHTGLANLAAAKASRMEADRNSRVLQFSSPSFDAMLTELLMAFWAGATLVIPPPGRLVGDTLADVLTGEKISHAVLPPSVLATLPAAEMTDLRSLIVAGEECPPDLVARWAPGRTLVNAYGPTEATVCATMSDPLAAAGPAPIGRPLPGVRVHLLDADRRPVADGEVGEIYLGGIGLADGYLGRPELTAERFADDGSGRLYRTGDLARLGPDGQYVFAGRNDDQVKLRGFRIELGEVAAHLRSHPQVRDAAAAVREDRPGRRRLVGYAVATTGRRPTPAELREHLATRLPDYLVPAAVVLLDALPLTTSGKLDRAALPEPPAAGDRGDERAGTAAEETLRAIFAEVLGLGAVDLDRSFFELGGDSMLATTLIMQARAAGLAITPRTVFNHPTVRSLAAAARPAGDERAGGER